MLYLHFRRLYTASYSMRGKEVKAFSTHLFITARKRIFLHLSVILFTGRGSASVHASVHAGIPPQPPPPGPCTHPPLDHAPTHPSTMHPPRTMHPSPPRPCTHPPPDHAHTNPPTMQPPPPGTEHAGRYGQRAGGTHPTGMQSCLACACPYFNAMFLITINIYVKNGKHASQTTCYLVQAILPLVHTTCTCKRFINLHAVNKHSLAYVHLFSTNEETKILQTKLQ